VTAHLLGTPRGSSAALLTSPSAKPARAVKASPTGPSAAGCAAVALTGRADEATPQHNDPRLPSTHNNMTTPETGCELHAQISEKDSDTGQSAAPEFAYTPRAASYVGQHWDLC
jgi:hypothetical protein